MSLIPLRDVQPEKADLLPREAKQFKVLASPAGLLMRGRDARFYLVIRRISR